MLASSHEQQGDAAAAISQFVHQLALIQLLSDTLWSLHRSGHFGYDAYQTHFELTQPAVAIHDALQAAKASLAWWDQLVVEVRGKYNSLNVCMLRQLTPLFHLLEAMPPANSDDIALMVGLQAALGETINLVAPQMLNAASSAALEAATVALADTWRRTCHHLSAELQPAPTRKDHLAQVQLHRLAESIDAALLLIPRRVRPVSRGLVGIAAAHQPVEEDGERVLEGVAGPLPGGVHLACAEAEVSALQLLVSACVNHGALPERESSLLCWEGSDLEEIGNFLRRWLASGSDDSTASLYTLCGIDLLPLEAQHGLAALLQHAMASSTSTSMAGRQAMRPRPPLLLVCTSSETSPLLMTLGYLRRPLRGPLEPLSRKQIRRLLAPCGYSILSAVTGGGKSFAVRSTAAAEGRTYLHVPVHTSAHGPLLRCIRRGLAVLPCDEHLLIHLDLSTGVQYSVDKVWSSNPIPLHILSHPTPYPIITHPIPYLIPPQPTPYRIIDS